MSTRRMAGALTEISQIERSLYTLSEHELDDAFVRIRRAISILERLEFFSGQEETIDLQIQAILQIQGIAYYNPETAGIVDIADWCHETWLRLLHGRPDDVDILRGVGRWWFLKAQPALSRIHALDSSSMSSSEARQWRHGHDRGYGHVDEDPLARQALAEAEAEERLHTEDYVEARGLLLPVTDYLSRAVEIAEEDDCVTGELLVTAAEAYMNLGNVSSTRVSVEYFRQAIFFLRDAAAVPGFRLPRHLRRYIESYGQYVD